MRISKSEEFIISITRFVYPLATRTILCLCLIEQISTTAIQSMADHLAIIESMLSITRNATLKNIYSLTLNRMGNLSSIMASEGGMNLCVELGKISGGCTLCPSRNRGKVT